jgi:hypothetical protein
MGMYNDLIAMPRAEDLLRWKIPVPVLMRFSQIEGAAGCGGGFHDCP